MANTPSTLELWYNGLLVGRITDILYSDGTWFGLFDKTMTEKGRVADRINQYITFSVDWNKRCEADPDDPEPEDFDQYKDLDSGLWYTQSPEGTTQRLDGLPLFSEGNEISWSTQGAPPNKNKLSRQG